MKTALKTTLLSTLATISLGLGVTIATTTSAQAYPTHFKTISGTSCHAGRTTFEDELHRNNYGGIYKKTDTATISWVYCPIEVDTKTSGIDTLIYLYYTKKPGSTMYCQASTMSWNGVAQLLSFPSLSVGTNEYVSLSVPTSSWGHIDVYCYLHKENDAIKQINYRLQ